MREMNVEGSIFEEAKRRRERIERDKVRQLQDFERLIKDVLRTTGVTDISSFVVSSPNEGQPPQGLRGHSLPSHPGVSIKSDGSWSFVHAEAWDNPTEKTIPIEDPLNYFFALNRGSIGVDYYGSIEKARERLIGQGNKTTTTLEVRIGLETLQIEGVTLEDLDNPVKLAAHFFINLIEKRQKEGRDIVTGETS